MPWVSDHRVHAHAASWPPAPPPRSSAIEGVGVWIEGVGWGPGAAGEAIDPTVGGSVEAEQVG